MALLAILGMTNGHRIGSARAFPIPSPCNSHPALSSDGHPQTLDGNKPLAIGCLCRRTLPSIVPIRQQTT